MRSVALAAKLRPGVLRRLTAAVALRVDYPAVLAFTPASRNSLRSLRSLRSDNRDENIGAARCARSRESCVPRRCKGAPQPARAQLGKNFFWIRRKKQMPSYGGWFPAVMLAQRPDIFAAATRAACEKPQARQLMQQSH